MNNDVKLVRKVADVNGRHTDGVEHPVIKGVAIVVLVRAERMRHSLDGVEDGTDKVIRGIHFVLGAGEREGERK